MRRVYLVRHGKAADEGYENDEDRPLTSEGRERMRRNAAALLKHAHPRPDLWLCSPLVRAVQTCEICVEAFHTDGPVEITRALIPSAQVGALAALIDQRDEATLALVGHEPLLSALATHLLGWPSLGGAFKKGGVVAIDLPRSGGAGKLVFHLRPAGGDRPPQLLDSV